MPTTRIMEADHQLLQGLAQTTGKQQQEIIHEALAQYHRDQVLDQINAAFAQLKSDPDAWKAEREERTEWEDTLADGVSE